MTTDRARWSNTNTVAPDWAERAAFVSRLLPENLRIADIGCGAMDLERFAHPMEYRPIDLFKRDERTKIIDLNEEVLPTSWLQECDLVAALGLLEYIDEPKRIFDAVRASGAAFLFSYPHTDFSVVDSEGSENRISNLSSTDIETLIADSDLCIFKKVKYADRDHVYLCYPIGQTPKVFVHSGYPASKAPGRKPRLVIAGFFARGNCGDEALLQCIYEALNNNFDLLISLDEHGAYKGYWDWYPYNLVPRAHQTNLSLFGGSDNVAGILVGGGNLPTGFAANQVLATRKMGGKAALAGVEYYPVDIESQFSSPEQHNSFLISAEQYAELFDYRALRSGQAVKNARLAGLSYNHGGDWALLLPIDEDPAVEHDNGRVLLILREYALKEVDYSYAQEILRLIDALEARNLHPSFLPFCSEDERFLSEIDLDRRLPIIRTWWNPRRAKQWIARSGMTLSLGRLHPIIFGATTGAKIAAVTAPVASTRDNSAAKISYTCEELGVMAFDSINSMTDGIDMIARADPEKVLRSLARVDAMISDIKRLFLGSA